MKKEEKEFLLNNYSKLGGKKCSEILGISKNAIYIFASKNNLKIESGVLKSIASKRSLENWKNHQYNDSDYKVSTNFFKKCNTPESAYILGLLWADGTVYKRDYQNRVAIECLKDDMNIWIPYFKGSGEWNVFRRNGKISGKEMINLYTNNKQLVDFLLKNDYGNKSEASPDKILSIIPNKLKRYFFRGWIDGDGCFYFNKKNHTRQFYLSGAIQQKWDCFEYLLQSLNIKSSICRISNKHSYSCIRITNKIDINKLGNYIYENFELDRIGLKRKYLIYQDIIK